MLLLEKAHYEVAKFDMTGLTDLAPKNILDIMTAEQQLKIMIEAGLEPYDIHQGEDNLLMYAGASWFLEALKGTTLSGGSGATLLVPYSNANAYIEVGESTTAAAATQTALSGSTLTRKAMDSTYPLHTDGATSPAASIIFRSTFATGDANIAWNEWGIFNASSAGRMLNRKVESLGTKTSSASWQFTVTLTLA